MGQNPVQGQPSFGAKGSSRKTLFRHLWRSCSAAWKPKRRTDGSTNNYSAHRTNGLDVRGWARRRWRWGTVALSWCFARLEWHRQPSTVDNETRELQAREGEAPIAGARGVCRSGGGQKKKELMGAFRCAGRELWRKGEPNNSKRPAIPPLMLSKVHIAGCSKAESLHRHHGVPWLDGYEEYAGALLHRSGVGKGQPVRVYDIDANRGWVSVGISSDTGAFAAESIRRWWKASSESLYSTAREPIMTADCGGGRREHSR